MESLEQTVATSVRSTAETVESVLVKSIRLAALPFILSLKLFKKSIPPALHLAILLSLLPILGFFSVFAGYVVVSWLPKGWSYEAHLQYGQGVPPFAVVDIPGLSYQPYDISLHLVVPQTESNYALGNFMASVTLMNTYNKTLSVSQRPAILVPSKKLFRPVSPSLTTVVIPLFDSYVPPTSNMRAKIEVGRQDGWQSVGLGEGKELSVAQTRLKGIVKLGGVVKILSKSRMLTFFVTSTTFFATSTFVMIVIYLIFAPSFSPEAEEDAEPSEKSIKVGDASPRESLSRRSRKSSTSSIGRPVKKEEAEEPTLRRRRSRLSQGSVASSSRVPLS